MSREHRKTEPILHPYRNRNGDLMPRFAIRFHQETARMPRRSRRGGMAYATSVSVLHTSTSRVNFIP